MPVEGWTNVSIKVDQSKRIKRLFDTIIGKEVKWFEWCGQMLDNAVLRERFLKENYPYIRFVGNVKNGCVLEDTRTKSVVNVTIRGSKITSSPSGESYIIYAMLTPRLILD
ncbi:hypothetical protein FJZ21_04020 [Candidatus Pacearchaeota archaeon]|nr:hypothetical protein [Candidatus Pacearchaeota archaeon]